MCADLDPKSKLPGQGRAGDPPAEMDGCSAAADEESCGLAGLLEMAELRAARNSATIAAWRAARAQNSVPVDLPRLHQGCESKLLAYGVRLHILEQPTESFDRLGFAAPIGATKAMYLGVSAADREALQLRDPGMRDAAIILPQGASAEQRNKVLYRGLIEAGHYLQRRECEIAALELHTRFGIAPEQALLFTDHLLGRLSLLFQLGQNKMNSAESDAKLSVLQRMLVMLLSPAGADYLSRQATAVAPQTIDAQCGSAEWHEALIGALRGLAERFFPNIAPLYRPLSAAEAQYLTLAWIAEEGALGEEPQEGDQEQSPE